MYEYIKGEIIELTPTNIILESSAIGYNLLISLRSYEDFHTKTQATVYVQQYAIRDELPILFGFSTKEERGIFRLLIGVSGVGGNTARTILSTYNVIELQQIISTSNTAMLKRVKGLGIKTAEKVIVELRDKITNVDTTALGESSSTGIYSSDTYSEALSALVMLGFKKEASQKVIKQVMETDHTISVEEVIKKSLKNL